MEVNRIEVVKNWSEPKLVRDIQVFLDFANFHWRFIKNFSRITTLLILMLKTTRLSDEPTPNRNDGSKSAFSRNNDSKLACKE